jgi:hypothetical protein
MVVLNDTEANSTRLVVAGVGGALAIGLYVLAPVLSRRSREMTADV